MEPSVFSLLSKKIVTAVISIGSLFYSTIPGINASIGDIELKNKGDQLVISSHLENCYTEELDQIFKSGKEIKIYFLAQLINSQKKKSIKDSTFYHSIRYTVLDDVFEVYHSESQQYFNNLYLQQAKTILSEIERYPVFSAEKLEEKTLYHIKITAWMGKIQLAGMDEPLNLMYYWNSIKPSSESNPFTNSIFEK